MLGLEPSLRGFGGFVRMGAGLKAKMQANRRLA